METKNCQNCKKDFAIEEEDFSFYEKIKVPAPTFCPECRLVRRLSWRNERALYKRECDLCREITMSVFAPEKPNKAYCNKCWWGDKWDAVSFGEKYDSSKKFFLQFSEFLKKVPLMSLYVQAASLQNSDYVNMSSYLKDCYMVTTAETNENCSYGSFLTKSKDSMDCLMITGCEMCYQLVNCNQCYNTSYSVDCDECVDVLFSKNCIGCQNCFGCINLRKKQYCIFNEQKTKEEYQDFIKNIKPFSRSSIHDLEIQARQHWSRYPQRYMHGRKNIDATGDYLYNSKNAKNCFISGDLQDCKYCSLVVPETGTLKDAYDCTHFVFHTELAYESIQSGHNSQNILFSLLAIAGCREVEYSVFLINCKNCFGCVSLHNKEYCIFNTQYTKEEYFALREKIISDMNNNPYIDAGGRIYKYGEFFPSELSLFGYNETSAEEFFSKLKGDALNKGFLWFEGKENIYTPTIKGKDIPGTIDETFENITKEIIECELTKKPFRITKNELSFYKRLGFPLPSIHPNIRHEIRIKDRNPLKLWPRKCMNPSSELGTGIGCQNEFETSYLPDRPEIVYCESCYQKEVS